MLDTFSLEMFENIAYVMAKHADTNIPDTQEEWLDGFNTFSIYQVLPQLIELWGLNVRTDVSAKKNFVQQIARWQHLYFRFVAYSWVLVFEIWICLQLASWMICMLKTATMIIKDIRKWRLRRTSTNFNQLVDFGVWTICKILILYCFCPDKWIWYS